MLNQTGDSLAFERTHSEMQIATLTAHLMEGDRMAAKRAARTLLGSRPPGVDHFHFDKLLFRPGVHGFPSQSESEGPAERHSALVQGVLSAPICRPQSMSPGRLAERPGEVGRAHAQDSK